MGTAEPAPNRTRDTHPELTRTTITRLVFTVAKVLAVHLHFHHVWNSLGIRGLIGYSKHANPLDKLQSLHHRPFALIDASCDQVTRHTFVEVHASLFPVNDSGFRRLQHKNSVVTSTPSNGNVLTQDQRANVPRCEMQTSSKA